MVSTAAVGAYSNQEHIQDLPKAGEADNGERAVRAYDRDLGAELPAGSRGQFKKISHTFFRTF